MRFDLNDLRLFLAIVDAGSITRGAGDSHLSLAAASERLRNMEEEAGLRLLERRPRGVATTLAGESLAHHARMILRQSETLREDMARHVRTDTVRLYANTEAIAEFLPERLAQWLARHPGIALDLRERTSAETVAAVEAGVAELGIVSDSVDARGLRLHDLADARLVLAVPAGHPAAGQGGSTLAQLSREAFVGLFSASALQAHIDSQARQAGQRLAYRVRMKTFRGVCEMVSQGVGIAVVPESSARRHRPGMGFDTAALREPWAMRRLCLCRRDGVELPPPVRDLARHLSGGHEP